MNVLILLAYISGSGPWCAASNSGNLSCFYWSYDACMTVVQSSPYYVACVPNPNRD